jgi:hypothetical protein
MIHLNMLGVQPAEPGAETLSDRPHIPLRIAEVREVKAPPVPQPLPGHLCEQCLDASAVVVVPAPWGGEMGGCDTCHQAPAVAALPILTAEEGQQTIWHTIHDPERLAPIVSPPRFPCQRGGIAACRRLQHVSALVGVIGYAGARTMRCDTILCRSPGAVHLLACGKSYPSWASDTTALKVTRSIGAWVSFLHWWCTCGGTSTPSPSETI